MTRLALIGGLVVAMNLQTVPASAKDLRIGVVDMQRAVSETEEGKAEEVKLMKTKKNVEDQLNRKIKEFYQEEEKLRKAWSILKEAERTKRAEESRKKLEGLQKEALEAERDLMGKKTKVMLKITQKLNKVIERIAKQEKFDYIFANAAVLWAPSHVDITNEVIRLYNRQK